MRSHTLLALASVAALTACAQAAQPTPKTDEEKALYALGVAQGHDLQVLSLTDQELEFLKAGVADGARDSAKLEQEEMEKVMPKLQELYMKRVEERSTKEKEAGTAFLAKAAAEKGATQTASKMVYKSVQEGSGATPTADDMVKVHYEGRFVSGKVFDSSIKRKEPATLALNGVIPCWTEGLQLMKVGGKAQLTCPPDLAYGEQGRPPQMPGNATLVFDVELLDIVKEDAAAASAEQPAAGK